MNQALGRRLVGKEDRAHQTRQANPTAVCHKMSNHLALRPRIRPLTANSSLEVAVCLGTSSRISGCRLTPPLSIT
jgi:hypothetical protein